jgi:hypothetical protein
VCDTVRRSKVFSDDVHASLNVCAKPSSILVAFRPCSFVAFYSSSFLLLLRLPDLSCSGGRNA